ncbi:MAG: hypothetical protein M1825_005847 [Sarcosagium campestre]|nr:MAG: hypothetical protein M1825_005847 [Sarcosagium campestre]
MPPSSQPNGNNAAGSTALASSASRTASTPLGPRDSPIRPGPSATATQAGPQAGPTQRKNKHKNKKKKRNRRQSFAIRSEPEAGDRDALPSRSNSQSNILDASNTPRRPTMYRLGQSGGNLSNTSLDSESLLDHRDQQSLRPRRQSLMGQGAFGPRPGQPTRSSHAHPSSGGESEGDGTENADDRTPLLSATPRGRQTSHRSMFQATSSAKKPSTASPASSMSSRRRRRVDNGKVYSASPLEYDVNNPPSVPSSPKIGPDAGFGDVMVSSGYGIPRPSETRTQSLPGDSLIDIDEENAEDSYESQASPHALRKDFSEQRRHTIALKADQDVCFPLDGLSELAEEDSARAQGGQEAPTRRRRRIRQWPDLGVLDDWSREEKEQRSEGIRAKKISEPVLVGGRLRPNKGGWHRAEEDEPYRFTYFNEEFPSTIHSQTISELLQPGQSFRELFIPDPPELSDDESGDEDDILSYRGGGGGEPQGPNSSLDPNPPATRRSSLHADQRSETRHSSGDATPSQPQPQGAKGRRYGARPTFWLDVLSPTETEMRVISKTFGIHPLTAEDIMMQEAREKVELFRNYYFVNYRTFEQDVNSEDYLDPVDMYVVVFREGVISFHFSMIPHPANVRRRIRQLKDYLILSSDWISYAIIDDITDVFAPLIQSLEDQVDEIEDSILGLQPSDNEDARERKASKDGNDGNEKRSEAGSPTSGDSGTDMLRRVGDCRKKVMSMLRLLGNKADVIKGFAKRCNEQWDIAPRSEIGLYLGDIQDHIITMTSNLSHYEKILSRSHSNYLARISIRMNERQEQTADTLGRLTVLGTIVLPMNIITGLWGMNCLVPGQDVESLSWFWGLTAGLIVFGFTCFFVAKKVYKIV